MAIEIPGHRHHGIIASKGSDAVAPYTMITQPTGDNYRADCPDLLGGSVTGAMVAERQNQFIGAFVKHLLNTFTAS